MRRAMIGCLVAALLSLATPSPVLAQDTRYVYDALGRLIGVIDAQGQITIYEYDEVGNIRAIRRPATGDPLAITFVNPGSGVAGTVVEIVGVGFAATSQDNQLFFNGVAAVVSGATPTRLTAIVPAGATTGPIRVTTASGAAESPTPFTILSLAVFPTQATVAAGRTRQFTASLAGTLDPGIVWSVDGLPGGSPATGTITPAGLYTAPVDIPILPIVQLQARSVRYPQLTADAVVALVPPSTSVIATPVDIRVVRLGTGDAGGLPVNVTVAAPPTIVVARPGVGEPGALLGNITVAAPSAIAITRTGLGDPDGQRLNVTVAAPPHIVVVKLGAGDADGVLPGVTVALPSRIAVTRPGIGDTGETPGVTVARPPDVRVRRP